MKKSKLLYTSMSRGEKIWGWIYFAFSVALLPTLLSWLSGQLSSPLSAGTRNFVLYLINFGAIVLIFHSFLRDSLVNFWRDLWNVIQAVILGYVAYWASSRALNFCMSYLFPGFSNINDSSVAAMAKTNYYQMVIGVVLLVPLVEEVLYRGLIFRNLLQTSKAAAYLLSMVVFAAVHVIGYIDSESVTTLILCFIQYLPAGLCLAWTYTKADNLFAPVLVHAIVNAVAIGVLR